MVCVGLQACGGEGKALKSPPSTKKLPGYRKPLRPNANMVDCSDFLGQLTQKRGQSGLWFSPDTLFTSRHNQTVSCVFDTKWFPLCWPKIVFLALPLTVYLLQQDSYVFCEDVERICLKVLNKSSVDEIKLYSVRTCVRVFVRSKQTKL